MDAAQEKLAQDYAREGMQRAAEALGLPISPEVAEMLTRLAAAGVDALSGRVYRELHAKAVEEAAKLKTVAAAEASRRERLKDR